MRSAARNSDQRRAEHDVVGDDAAGDRHAEQRQIEQREARAQHLRHAEGAAVLAAGEVGELRRQDGEGRGDGQRHHGEEDGPHAQREQADQQRQRDARDQRDGEARQRRCPGRAPAVEREPDAVAAEPVEHGVGERDDAGIAEQQVVARHQHDEDAHLGGGVDGLRAAEQERRQRQHRQDGTDRAAPAARQVAGEDRVDHGPLPACDGHVRGEARGEGSSPVLAPPAALEDDGAIGRRMPSPHRLATG